MTEEVIIHCDGASRGNPGEAGIGYIIESTSGVPLKENATTWDRQQIMLRNTRPWYALCRTA